MRQAAEATAEEAVTDLKSALFDPAQSAQDVAEIYRLDTWLRRLRKLDGAVLVDEYRLWLRVHPDLTAAMVRSGLIHETANRRAILRWLESEAVA